MHNPSKDHMNVVMRILRYLKSAPEKGLVFRKHGHLRTSGYTDVDWAGNITDMRFTSGYFTFVGGNLVDHLEKQETECGGPFLNPHFGIIQEFAQKFQNLCRNFIACVRRRPAELEGELGIKSKLGTSSSSLGRWMVVLRFHEGEISPESHGCVCWSFAINFLFQPP
ncbi:hypothetical protein ACLB2K_046794 [Fragaria x ananassa]